MIGGVQNIARITELRNRILFTFGMLAIYRLGAFVVTPGINAEVIRSFFQQMQGTMFGLFSMFSGGALEQLSIFSLGIMPYISASIIFQLLTVVIPHLETLKKEGEQGRKKINQYTRYATIGLAMFQSMMIAVALENGSFGQGAVAFPGWGFRLMCMITLTTGTAFIMWLGEQITERGIGNGISLIIFAGIIINIPSGIGQLIQLIRTDQFSILQTLTFGVIGIAVGFAAKDTLANLISGVSIIADAPYKIGDYIVLDTGERGVVTELGMRSTRLLTRDDVEISIPNAVMGNAKITNESGGPAVEHRIRIPVGVAYGTKPARVVEVLEQIANENGLTVKEPAPRARMRAFADSSINFELLSWIRLPEQRGLVQHQILMEIERRFEEEGIHIPFPQRDIHIRTGALGAEPEEPR